MPRPAVTRETIYLARWGNPLAKEQVIFGFTPFLWKLINDHAPKLQRQEAFSAALTGLLHALQEWDEDRGTFGTAVALQVRKELQTVKRADEKEAKLNLVPYQAQPNYEDQVMVKLPTATMPPTHCVTCGEQRPLVSGVCATCEKQITRMRYWHNVPGICPHCVVPLRSKNHEPYCPSCNYNPHIHKYE